MKCETSEEEEIVSYTRHGKPVVQRKKIQNELVLHTAPQVVVAEEFPNIVARRGGRHVDEEQPTPRQTPTSGSKMAAAPQRLTPTERAVHIYPSECNLGNTYDEPNSISIAYTYAFLCVLFRRESWILIKRERQKGHTL